MAHGWVGERPTVPDKAALPECPISWQPNALAPVFYGYQDVAPVAPMRVLYPTLDRSPQNAQILAHCGLYPLIVFTHGQCSEAQGDVYLYWGASRLATQLARAGYVVVVPQLSGSGFDLGIVSRVVDWMRADWEHSQFLAPSMGTVGHSLGVNTAGLMASEGSVEAFVGLSGVWETPGGVPPPINVPQLHVLGGDDVSMVGDVYGIAQRPKHRVFIDRAQHYDYLPVTPCQAGRGPCSCTAGIVADVVTMFFGMYLSPIDGLPQRIPPLLIPPPLTLSNEQWFYADTYLSKLWCTTEEVAQCSVTLSFEERDGVGESETIQWSSNVHDHRRA